MFNKAAAHKSTSVIIMNQGNLSPQDYTDMCAIFENTDILQNYESVKNSDVLVYSNGKLMDKDSSMEWLATNNITFSITDAGLTSLVFAGNEFSRQRDGLNVALYNSDSCEIYHYISFAKEHNWTPYTK